MTVLSQVSGIIMITTQSTITAVNVVLAAAAAATTTTRCRTRREENHRGHWNLCDVTTAPILHTRRDVN